MVWSFRWPVGDHQIVSGNSDEDPGTRFLVATGTARRETHPLNDKTGLFQDFARLQDDEHSLLAFANRHGLLGGVARVRVSTDARADGGVGESVSRWRAEGELMRSALRLWDSRENRNAWATATNDLFAAEDELHWLDMPRVPVLRPEGIRADSALAEAAILNGTARDRGLFVLSSVINRVLESRLSVALVMTPGFDSLEMAVEPDSLRTAMWLQLAMAVSRQVGYRPCETCGSYFEVSTEPTGKRTNRKHCGDACKSRAYRIRQNAGR